MNIQKRAKIDIYYLILFWATRESIKQDVFFVDKNIMFKIAFLNRGLILKKQRQSKNLKKETIKLLAKIQALSVNMELLAFEMLVYITLNFLMNEIKDKDMKRYKDIPIGKIFDDINKKHKTRLNEHCDFIDKNEEEI